MKKFVIWSAVIIIIVVLLGFICASVASRRIEYDIMDEETVNIVFDDGKYKPGNADFVSKMLNIDAEDAVKIAKEAWSSRFTLDNFEVYYDEENEWYFVYAWYILPEERFSTLMIKLFDDPDDYIWENTCTTLIDKNTGAVLNMDGWGVAKLDTDPLLAELPVYKDEKCYKGTGFQDYTKYCEYCYMDNVLNLLDKSSYLKKVTSDDISTVVNYFENFKKWIEHEDFRHNYNFDKEFVSEGDYFYIDNNYPNEDFDYNPEKYPTYNAYWFDRETLTMYFIHNGV